MIYFMPRSDLRGRTLPGRNSEAVWRSPQYDQKVAEFSRSARLPLARTSKKLGPYMARIDAILAGDSRVEWPLDAQTGGSRPRKHRGRLIGEGHHDRVVVSG